MFVLNYRRLPRSKFGIVSFAIFPTTKRAQNIPADEIAKSHNTEITTQEIEKTVKDVINNIVNGIAVLRIWRWHLVENLSTGRRFQHWTGRLDQRRRGRCASGGSAE